MGILIWLKVKKIVGMMRWYISFTPGETCYFLFLFLEVLDHILVWLLS